MNRKLPIEILQDVFGQLNGEEKDIKPCMFVCKT